MFTSMIFMCIFKKIEFKEMFLPMNIYSAAP